MVLKRMFVSSVLTIVAAQTALAHQSLTPHVHPVEGAFYVSWLEIAAGLTAAALAIAYFRYRQAQFKKEKVRRR